VLIRNKIRKILARYPYLETTVLMGLYFAIGYIINSQDICMLESKSYQITILIAIITLFHGMSSGILAMGLVGIILKFFYVEFPYELFISHFILVLIFGEFYYYWNRTIDSHSVENIFVNKKLSELGKAFYTLKISHDQIEKSYVTKPMSLRNSIAVIKQNLASDNPDKGYQDFLLLIRKTVNIDEAYIILVEDDGSMSTLAHTNETSLFNPKDLMVQKAIEKQMPIYVSNNKLNCVSEYLAVIPAISNKELKGLFIIKKMPFLSFNKDSFITVSILVSYFFDELHKVNTLKTMDDLYGNFQENFRFELHRLDRLYQQYHIDSTVLVLKSYDKLQTHVLKENLDENLRTLEVYSLIEGDEFDAIAILFPLVDKASVKGFTKRLIDIYKENELLEYSNFSMSEIELVLTYIKDETCLL